MLLRDEAIKAYEKQVEAARKDDEDLERNRKRTNAELLLATVRHHLKSWLDIHLDANIEATEDGIVSVDGISMGRGENGLRLLYPCPKCGEMIWSESFIGLVGLGEMLSDPKPAFGSYGPQHHCPAEQQPDPEDNRETNVTPQPLTLAEQLESVVRRIAREEFNALQVVE